MAKLVWDQEGERFYETGVDRGVLYPMQEDNGTYPKGYAWSGLTAVTLSPSGAEASPIYADNIKYLNLMSVEEVGATIEAYTYPKEFEACDGSAELTTGLTVGQQERKPFGFCWRTILGNDTKKNDNGYKLHILYHALASPSERSYATVNESPEAITISWEVTTTPVNVPNHTPSAYLCIDSTKADPEKLAALEKILYGDESTEARLPLPEEIVTTLTKNE